MQSCPNLAIAPKLLKCFRFDDLLAALMVNNWPGAPTALGAARYQPRVAPDLLPVAPDRINFFKARFVSRQALELLDLL